MSFYGATDTPILDFWWCLLSLSQPELAALFARGRCGATPANLLMASMSASHRWQHVCFSRGSGPDSNMNESESLDVDWFLSL